MAGKTTYSVEIDGPALDTALGQLDVLDSSNAGDVRLKSDGSNLCLTRISRKREMAEVDVPATGYLPSTVRIPWKRLKLLLDGHSETVRILLTLDNNGGGSLRIDSMLVDFQSRTEQLSLPLGALSLPHPDRLVDRLERRLKELDIENQAKPPQQLEALAKRYERDPELTKIIKLLRGGKCQICGFSFKTKSGDDYSECHHLEHLADSGLDISSNILVLCANHHRQFHYGNVELLNRSPGTIEVSLDGAHYICKIGSKNNVL